MKQPFLLLTFYFIFLTTFSSFGNVPPYFNSQSSTTTNIDTTKSSGISQKEDADDAPMLLFVILFIFFIAMLGIGIGIVLTTLILSLLFGLVSFGILSTSIIIGLNKKSFEKGFKTFIVLASTIGGLLLGLFVFWMLNKIQHWWTMQNAFISGAICGLISGFLFGQLAFYILKRLTNYFKLKLKL